MTVTGRRSVVLVAIFLAVGCATAPEYRDPVARLQPPAAARPFAGQSVRVVLSDNWPLVTEHMAASERWWSSWRRQIDFSPRMLTDRLKDVLERRFRRVEFATGDASASPSRADLTLVFDPRVVVGQVSFNTNSVDLTGIFLDEARRTIDTVTGKGTSTVPYPALTARFPAALDQAFGEFEKSLDAAAKLREFAAARVAPRPLAARPAEPAGGAVGDRVRSKAGRAWALVVGIDRYERAPRLNYAVADARAVAAALPGLGFSDVRMLLDEQATRAAIERVVYVDLKEHMGQNDRLFVFFAGHGVTVALPRGGEEGYLVPVDGDPDRPEITAIPMDEVRKIGRRVPAKHIFFAIDSCFSGFAATRDAAGGGDADLLSALDEPVVQVLTAGRKGQKAVETEGHGLFTRRLLDGLRGLADRDQRGFVTATQLAAWLTPRVTRDSGGLQHPQYSALDGEGDFVFVLPAPPR
jgi:Caspase domain